MEVCTLQRLQVVLPRPVTWARRRRPLRAKLAALEMEIEALKRGSDGGGSQTGSQNPAGDFAAALAAQTEALKEASAQRGGQSSTTVKTDLTWPTLTDDKSDARDVVLFYEEFEALANNCRGLSAREKLLALRGRCRGSRIKTHTNAFARRGSRERSTGGVRPHQEQALDSRNRGRKEKSAWMVSMPLFDVTTAVVAWRSQGWRAARAADLEGEPQGRLGLRTEGSSSPGCFPLCVLSDRLSERPVGRASRGLEGD